MLVGFVVIHYNCLCLLNEQQQNTQPPPHPKLPLIMFNYLPVLLFSFSMVKKAVYIFKKMIVRINH